MRVRKFLNSIFALSVVLGAAVSLHAKPVDNFTLLDQHGAAHELYYYSDADAVVLMAHGNGCPIARNAMIDFKAVRDEYESKGVQFLMVNSNLQDNRESILVETHEWEIDIPILVDDGQLVGDSLGLTRTTEVLVIDPEDWRVVYRGAINNRLAYERQYAEASEHYVKTALDNVLQGNSAELPSRTTKGCLINFPHRDNGSGKELTYVDDVAPILEQRCTNCHTDGGIGPWSMNSYEMVRGFAPMIREVLLTKRMPPWHADPHVGEWSNDRSLPIEEKQTLIHWIENGAVRGEGDDPLAALPSKVDGINWKYGEPDLIVRVPPFTVPASGVVDYKYHTIPADIKEGKWIKGFEVIPGDTNVVHHLLMGTVPAERSQGDGLFENYIGGYAPGAGYELVPEGTGIYLNPGHSFQVQMHYTPYGREVVDETVVGIYLYDEPPEKFLRQGVVLNTIIEIPPNTKAHEENAYYLFEDDAVLYQILPHSHYRGTASSFSLIHPDGSEELLLSVPNYDFNWQTGYSFATPKEILTGSKLVHRTVYDNSSQKPGNPNPDETVRWGLQSWEEMLYGAFTFSWKNETTENPTHNLGRVRTLQAIGMMDKNMNGGLEKSELQGRTGRRLAASFEQGDVDGDGSLNVNEFVRLTREMTRRALERRAELRNKKEGE